MRSIFKFGGCFKDCISSVCYRVVLWAHLSVKEANVAPMQNIEIMEVSVGDRFWVQRSLFGLRPDFLFENKEIRVDYLLSMQWHTSKPNKTILYYGMVKPLPTILCKAPGKPFRTQCNQHNGQRWGHSMTLGSWVADSTIEKKEKSFSTYTFQLLLWVHDDHWEIMSRNVVRKMI